jgi:hypothetical protein
LSAVLGVGAARRRHGLLAAVAAVAAVAFLLAPAPLVLAVPAGADRPATGTVQANSVHSFGATDLGDLSAAAPNRPVVGMASTADGGGYWLVGADGGVFNFGDAAFWGSTGGLVLDQPIVAMAGDPATGGYWLVAADGGVFAFNAPFHGSEGGQPLNAPIVGMAASPGGGGYWLVARGGGVFSFGDAVFRGSEGAQPLNAAVVGMASAPGGGYWLVARDGGIFSFGGAVFRGSEGGQRLNAPVVGLAATSDGGGYWLVARDGGVFNFGDAPFEGSALSAPDVPAVGIGAGGTGYRVAFGSTPSPFGPAVIGYLSQRADDVSMAVYDATTGLTWDLQPGQAQVTASIVKVDIMAAALAADQRAGRIPADQAALMAPMIEVSDNNAATAMWGLMGGAGGLAAFDGVVGLQGTTPYPGPITATNLGWAYSTTTADDMVRVVSLFAFSNPILSDPYRAYGLSLMHGVEPSQVWGVPAGAPPGSVAVKTGFITPAPGDAQVNSIGFVSGAGRSYVFAILTDGNPSEQYGEDTINTLATLVFDALGSG